MPPQTHPLGSGSRFMHRSGYHLAVCIVDVIAHLRQKGTTLGMELGAVDLQKNCRAEFGEGPMRAFQNLKLSAFDIDFYDVRGTQSACSVNAAVKRR